MGREVFGQSIGNKGSIFGTAWLIKRPNKVQRRTGKDRWQHNASPQSFLRSKKPPHTELQQFGFSNDFADEYEIGRFIGSGSFATVHEAIHRETKEKYAVKVVSKRFAGGYLDNYFVARIHHEVDIYSHLGASLNIAYLYGVFETDTSVEMVMELCSGGQLWDRVQKGRYSEKDAARIIRGILRAIAQCHAKNVIMRDVKPENFLFLNKRKDSPLKAIDFGLADYCSKTDYLWERCGTPIYIAPEVLRRQYSQEADVWSAGVIAYQLLTGRLPFSGEEGLAVSQLYIDRQLYSNKDVFRAVLYADLDFEGSLWDGISAEACHFVESLLQRDPTKRPTAEEALAHPWLSEGEGGAPEAPLNDSLVQRLQRFGTYGKLKRVALRELASFISADTDLVQDLEVAFAKMDPEELGRVKRSDVAAMLESKSFDLSKTEVRQLMAQMEADEEGYIDYLGWLTALLDWQKVQESALWDSWVERAFRAFDADGSGKLNPDELTAMLCGEFCEIPDTVPAALREADVDGDGKISLAEFAALMRTERSDTLSLFEDRRTQRKKDENSKNSKK